MSETTTLGVRLSTEEKKVIERAAEATASPGDRGGLSAWVRRVALAEAERVLAAKKGKRS